MALYLLRACVIPVWLSKLYCSTAVEGLYIIVCSHQYGLKGHANSDEKKDNHTIIQCFPAISRFPPTLTTCPGHLVSWLLCDIDAVPEMYNTCDLVIHTVIWWSTQPNLRGLGTQPFLSSFASSAVSLSPPLPHFLKCCHVAPPAGQQKGNRLGWWSSVLREQLWGKQETQGLTVECLCGLESGLGKLPARKWWAHCSLFMSEREEAAQRSWERTELSQILCQSLFTMY